MKHRRETAEVVDRANALASAGRRAAFATVNYYDPPNLTFPFGSYIAVVDIDTVTPSPHHPLGAKGIRESPTVGAPPAIANAVVDALAHLGVKHLDIPITPEKVWKILHEKGVAE